MEKIWNIATCKVIQKQNMKHIIPRSSNGRCMVLVSPDHPHHHHHHHCYLHLHLLCHLLLHLHYQHINCHYVPWLYHQCLTRLKEHAQSQTIQHNCWSIQTHNEVEYSWLKDLPQQLSCTTSLCTMIFWFSPLAPVYMVETNTDQHFFRVVTIFGKLNSRSF